ncbi:hypothetical protein A9Q99_06635 [Gammaproteobacteria bacterium 45_16_T64]|nr:hypothetical protein A9Q99_06635 [Gammaproteobacteria bacterium 45_16_T64]
MVRRLLGYFFILLGFVGIAALGKGAFEFVQAPTANPLHAYLVEIPEADRTMKTSQGNIVMPVGIFSASAIFFTIVLFFWGAGFVKLFLNLGVRILAPNVDDFAKTLIDKVEDRIKAGG